MPKFGQNSNKTCIWTLRVSFEDLRYVNVWSLIDDFRSEAKLTLNLIFEIWNQSLTYMFHLSEDTLAMGLEKEHPCLQQYDQIYSSNLESLQLSLHTLATQLES